MMQKEKSTNRKSQNNRSLQIIISGGAILIAIAHIIWPSIKIDLITLALVVIAIIPWLAPLFKSLEFPGGWKIEFQDVQDAKDKAGKAGLLKSELKAEKPESAYLQIADQDPNLALAGLRIEIEKRLVRIAQVNNLPTQRAGVVQMLRILSERDILTNQERAALEDIIGVLNAAVHGASVDQRTGELAMEMGGKIIEALDEKISSREQK